MFRVGSIVKVIGPVCVEIPGSDEKQESKWSSPATGFEGLIGEVYNTATIRNESNGEGHPRQGNQIYMLAGEMGFIGLAGPETSFEVISYEPS